MALEASTFGSDSGIGKAELLEEEAHFAELSAGLLRGPDPEHTPVSIYGDRIGWDERKRGMLQKVVGVRTEFIVDETGGRHTNYDHCAWLVDKIMPADNR